MTDFNIEGADDNRKGRIAFCDVGWNESSENREATLDRKIDDWKKQGSFQPRCPMDHSGGGNVINSASSRVLILIDLQNVSGMAASRGRSVDFPHLSRFLAGGRTADGVHVFAAVHPFDGRRQEAFYAVLERAGLSVHVRRGKLKRGGRLDLDADTVLILEAMKLAESANPTTICLAAGDRDYAELVRYLRCRGVRIEVAATKEVLSRDLREAADKVIILDEYISRCAATRCRFQQLGLFPSAA